MDRDIFDSGLWANPIKFRLFFYLVGNAVFKDTPAYGMLIKRGQFLRSTRRLQQDLEYYDNNILKVYSRNTIQRYLIELETEKRITRTKTKLGTLIDIVNYEYYQAFSKKDTKGLRPPTEPASDPPIDPIRTKYNKLNINTPSSPLGDEEEFLVWYKAYPLHVGKLQARKAYWAARKTVSAEVLLEGIQRYRENKPQYAGWKHPATWLNGQCWEDDYNSSSTLPEVLSKAELALKGWLAAGVKSLVHKLRPGDPVPIGAFTVCDFNHALVSVNGIHEPVEYYIPYTEAQLRVVQ